MNINDFNIFNPKAVHTFDVEEIPIKIRRKKWRESEKERRKNLFGITSTNLISENDM